jgi:pimeloyl-ACP methyl ester carboxylesterase
MVMTIGVAVSAMSASGLLAQSSAATVAEPMAAGTGPAGNVTFDGPVPLGNGRSLYLHCEGTGSPTVVLISGYHDGSTPWSESEPVAPAVGPAVLPGLATKNRVCAYDRPGTLDYSKNPPTITTRSTAETMPRTAADVVNDLRSMLTAAGIPGPYVLVAHSMGGLFALLFARTHPAQVAGLVLVDAFSPKIPTLLGHAWSAYDKLLAHPSGLPQAREPGWEVINVNRSVTELDDAPPLKAQLPMAVVSKTEPFPLPTGIKGLSPSVVERVWNQTQKQLTALEPGTPQLIATGSDHYVQVRQPDLVIAATGLVLLRAAPLLRQAGLP